MLQYFTDVTQPMHAANFTALSSPFRLHSHLEHFAQHIQARQKYSFVPIKYGTRSPDQILVDAAKIAKPRWATLYKAIEDTYRERDGCYWAISYYDTESCWQEADRVNKLVFRDLDDARRWTAEYINAISNELPK